MCDCKNQAESGDVMSEAEERIDQVFINAFETNHPAMLDWVNVKFELKSLRAQLEEVNKRLSDSLPMEKVREIIESELPPVGFYNDTSEEVYIFAVCKRILNKLESYVKEVRGELS